jgi:hypothetical protein
MFRNISALSGGGRKIQGRKADLWLFTKRLGGSQLKLNFNRQRAVIGNFLNKLLPLK